MASIAIRQAHRPGLGLASGTGAEILWLIASVPILFALSTWSHEPPAHTLMGFFRFFSVPVLCVEAVVVLYAVVTQAGVRQRAMTMPGWMMASLAILAAIAIGTARFVAVDKGMAGISASFWFFHVGFALSVAALAEKHWAGEADRIWTAIIVGLLGYLAVAVVFVATVRHPDRFAWDIFNLGAIMIRHTAPYAIIGFAAAIAAGVLTGDAKRTRLMTLAALLFAAFIFWSGTRAALVGLAAMIGVGMAFFPLLREARAWRLIGVSIVGGALLSLVYVPPNPAFGILATLFRSQTSRSEDVSSGRIAIWKSTLGEIAKRPLFGHGDSQVSYVVPAATGRFNHPHDSILQFAFQWGLVGAGLFFAIVGTLWWRMTRAARAVPAQHLHAWLSVTGIAAISLLDGSLYFPYPVMMVAFAFAISEAMRRRGG